MKQTANLHVVAVVCCILLFSTNLPARADNGPRVSVSEAYTMTVPLRDQGLAPISVFEGEPVEVNPLGAAAKVSREGTTGFSELPAAPEGTGTVPPPIITFEGIGATGFIPPDTVGDVGPNHYVQAVNSHFAVFDKTTGAMLLGPLPLNSLFAGMPNICATTNSGDPVVLYDSLSDRWMISQFALDFSVPREFGQCIAVSTTPDPTGAYHSYYFFWSTTVFNDYPHFGIWPDGLYMAVNQFTPPTNSWAGQGVAAFEWNQMLAGNTAQMQAFDLFPHDANFGGQIPTDWEGTATPPPAGAPNLFIEWDDSTWIPPADALRIWQFHVDWGTPVNTTFGAGLNPNTILNTADVDPDMCGGSRNCIPQPPPATAGQYLDSIADRLLHRMTYRNMGTHESLMTNHTVDADGNDKAGIHWFELRDPFGSVGMYQQGVWAPDGHNRWMASMAMDKAGTIALGYSVSSLTVFPSIRYTVRLSGDPLGTFQPEQEAFTGAATQTSSSGRWGDYSSMNVAPDDSTFWYTTEYYPNAGSWHTGIAAFTVVSIFTDGFESGDISAWSASSPP